MSKKRETRGVYEHPPDSGIWRIDYYDAEGRRHREKIGKRSTAIDVYHQRKAAISEGRFVAKRRAPAVLFRQIAEERMRQLKPHLAYTSYFTDQVKLPLLYEWFGNRPASSISAETIREKTDALAEKMAGSSVNRYIALISSIYSHAIANGRVSENPCKKVKRHREPPNRLRFLGRDEELALREAIREIDPDFEYELDVFLNTGIRRQEYFALTWSAVDLENENLSVIGKGRKLRNIPINSAARAAFLKLHTLSKGSLYVSRSRAARRPFFQDGRSILRRALKAAGVSKTFASITTSGIRSRRASRWPASTWSRSSATWDTRRSRRLRSTCICRPTMRAKASSAWSRRNRRRSWTLLRTLPSR